MFEKKLEEILKQFDDLNRKLSEPDILADPQRYRDYAKAQSDLAPLAERIKRYKEVVKESHDTEELIAAETEAEMADFFRAELDSLEGRKSGLEQEIKDLIVTKDPMDEKDIIVEIRAGAGGDEASLFAGDLYKMYMKFAEAKGFATQMMNSSASDLGGFKEIILEVKGRGSYSEFKFESGVHRVQRIPVTESGGRIHTSTATVAVLPEVEDVEVSISPNDLKIDTFRSSGPGGQHVNVTDSAVRITHLPTGMVVSCQQERSQLQNRDRALKILRARLAEKLQRERQEEVAEARRLQVGSGDRSERIRTYNFPQNRVTDHRISLTLHNLDAVLEGELDSLVEALAAADRAERLKKIT